MVNCVEPQRLQLKEYTRRMRVFLRLFGFTSVYVIGRDNGGLCKIGLATDPALRFYNLVGSNPDVDGVYYLLWAPSKFIARNIENYAHEILTRAGLRHRNEWFSVPKNWAIETVKTAAHKAYPKIRFLDHPMMIEHLGAKNLELGDKTKDGKPVPRFTINFSDLERDLIAQAIVADPESPIVPDNLTLDDCVMLLNPSLRWGDIDIKRRAEARSREWRESNKPSKDSVVTIL